MSDGGFTWDSVKAALNLAKHGVSFEAARGVFRDAFAVEWLDDTQDDAELRFATIGMVESRLIFVAYTMRGEVIRIISARLAEPYERRRYHDENQV